MTTRPLRGCWGQTLPVRRIGCLLVLATQVCACGGGDKANEPLPSAPAAITLRSSAFAAGAAIPQRYTCSGAGVSPPLSWSGVPKRARELTLVVEDEDAGRFAHWTVLGIPPTTTRIEEGGAPAGAIEPNNSFGKRGWGPPCPPKGDAPHRYEFVLYATDARLGLGKDASPDDVARALGDDALARGTLVGRFGR
jgi:Raf kinase inhibitor-like YbhB/YbcL family protein